MLTAGEYRIDIYEDKGFKLGSADNAHSYDAVYFPDDEYVPATVFGIKIFEGEQLLNSVVVGANGGATTIHKNAVLIEENRIVLCCGNTVCCFTTPDLSLLWRTTADDATCFEIFKHDDSYIIHGELNISRIGKNGNIIWQRQGADIFLTLSGEDDFVLTDDFIIAKDFENRVYKFDYNGNSLMNT